MVRKREVGRVEGWRGGSFDVRSFGASWRSVERCLIAMCDVGWRYRSGYSLDLDIGGGEDDSSIRFKVLDGWRY